MVGGGALARRDPGRVAPVQDRRVFLQPDRPVQHRRQRPPGGTHALDDHDFGATRHLDGAGPAVLLPLRRPVCDLLAATGDEDLKNEGRADQTYDAMMFLYQSRFGEQIETAPTAEILDAWR